MLGQFCGERRVLRAVVVISADQDHGGSGSFAFIRDRHAIL
jgi:hypothetical protein